MKTLYYNIICFIVASVLFTDCFLCGLVCGVKSWFTGVLLHVYLGLKHPLNKLKGCLLFLNDSFYSFSDSVKNKIFSFFDPRIRDPHSVIANILILFALIPVFIFLFVTILSYKIIFIPVLQAMLYVRRGILVVRIFRFVGSFFGKLLTCAIPNLSFSMLAGLKVKPLFSVKSLEVHLTKMPAPAKQEFMEKYARIFVYNIEGLDNKEREMIIRRSLKFFESGLSGHFNISMIVPNSNVSGHPLLINAALTSSKPLDRLIAIINEEVIYSRPTLVVDLDKVVVDTFRESQYLLSNTFVVSNSEYTHFIDARSNPNISPSFCSDRNIHSFGYVAEKIRPLAERLSGVYEPDVARREIINFQKSVFSPDKEGFSAGLVFPVIETALKNLP